MAGPLPEVDFEEVAEAGPTCACHAAGIVKAAEEDEEAIHKVARKLFDEEVGTPLHSRW